MIIYVVLEIHTKNLDAISIGIVIASDKITRIIIVTITAIVVTLQIVTPTDSLSIVLSPTQKKKKNYISHSCAIKKIKNREENSICEFQLVQLIKYLIVE